MPRGFNQDGTYFQCGWLHSKLEGIEVAIDLAEKEEAFQIMAAAMEEQKFDYRPAEPEHDGQADNDDELRR